MPKKELWKFEMNNLVLFSILYIMCGILEGKNIEGKSTDPVKPMLRRYIEPNGNNTLDTTSMSNEGKNLTYATQDRFLPDGEVFRLFIVMTKEAATDKDNTSSIELPPVDVPTYPEMALRFSKYENTRNSRRGHQNQDSKISSQYLINDTGVTEVEHKYMDEENSKKELDRMIYAIFGNVSANQISTNIPLSTNPTSESLTESKMSVPVNPTASTSPSTSSNQAELGRVLSMPNLSKAKNNHEKMKPQIFVISITIFVMYFFMIKWNY